MKKNITKFGVGLMAIFLAVALLLAGCGLTTKPATKESLLENYYRAAEKAAGMSGDMTMDMDLSISIHDGAADSVSEVQTKANLAFESTDEFIHMFGEAVMTSLQNGESSDASSDTVEIDTYTVKSDDKVTTYVKDGDEWRKSEEDTDEQLTSTINGLKGIRLVAEEIKSAIMEETEDEYIIRVALKMEDLESLLGQMIDDITDEFGDMDAVDLESMPDIMLEYHFDKTSRDLKSMVLDMTETMNSLLNAMMKHSLEELFASMAGEIDGASDGALDSLDVSSLFNIQVRKMIIEMSNVLFLDTASFSLPEEVGAAVAAGLDEYAGLFDDNEDIDAEIEKELGSASALIEFDSVDEAYDYFKFDRRFPINTVDEYRFISALGLSGKVLEVMYQNEDLNLIVLRQAKAEDIELLKDMNNFDTLYEDLGTFTVADVEITARGSQGKIGAMMWQLGDYVYAASFDSWPTVKSVESIVALLTHDVG